MATVAAPRYRLCERRRVSTPILPPHPDPRRPQLALPALACDAHCHVFGPAARFPYSPGRAYTPPDAPLEQFELLQQRLGLQRAVFVQASCHGTDNAAMVDALERGDGRYAGVAMLDATCTDAQLDELHAVGVRGTRFNFVAHLGGAPDLDEFWHVVDKVAGRGWHIVLHFDAVDIPRHRSLLQRMPCPYVIDHMGRVPVTAGLDQEPFQRLLELLEDDRAWVKISGAERLTADGAAPYDDVVPFARALVGAAPERVLWGTDWPHPNVRVMPDDGDLVDLLAQLLPDPTERQRVLVANPATLYDFR